AREGGPRRAPELGGLGRPRHALPRAVLDRVLPEALHGRPEGLPHARRPPRGPPGDRGAGVAASAPPPATGRGVLPRRDASARSAADGARGARSARRRGPALPRAPFRPGRDTDAAGLSSSTARYAARARRPTAGQLNSRSKNARTAARSGSFGRRATSRSARAKAPGSPTGQSSRGAAAP